MCGTSANGVRQGALVNAGEVPLAEQRPAGRQHRRVASAPCTSVVTSSASSALAGPRRGRSAVWRSSSSISSRDRNVNTRSSPGTSASPTLSQNW